MTESGNGLPKVPLRVPDLVLGIAFVVIVSVTIILGARQLLGNDGDSTGTLPPWLGFLFQGTLVVAVWQFAIRRRGATWSDVGLRMPLREGDMFLLPLFAVIVMFLVSAIYGIVVQSLEIDILTQPSLEDQGDILGTGINLYLNGLVAVIWGPFTEELFFRGFLLAGLLVVLDKSKAVIVSALVFASAHVLLSTLVPIFLLGVILAWLFVRTRSVWPPFVAHSVWNLIVTLGALYIAQ